MPNYIDRDWTAKRIAASPLVDSIPAFIRHGIIDLVQNIPSADVVEVVRCKDCVSCRTLRRNDRFEALYPEDSVYCMREDCGKSKDDFCSWGERKEQT
jgi:hypothetical protein